MLIHLNIISAHYTQKKARKICKINFSFCALFLRKSINASNKQRWEAMNEWMSRKMMEKKKKNQLLAAISLSAHTSAALLSHKLYIIWPNCTVTVIHIFFAATVYEMVCIVRELAVHACVLRRLCNLWVSAQRF